MTVTSEPEGILNPGAIDEITIDDRGVALHVTQTSVWDGSVETFEAAWEISEYDPVSELRVGDLRLSFAPTKHYTTCYAIRIDGDYLTVARRGTSRQWWYRLWQTLLPAREHPVTEPL